MEIKALEIRDSMTFIPAVAIRMVPDPKALKEEFYLLRRCGYDLSVPAIVLMRLADQSATSDPFGWGKTRTMSVAHQWILQNWDTIKSGDVIDVEFLKGETKEPKKSEQYEVIP